IMNSLPSTVMRQSAILQPTSAIALATSRIKPGRSEPIADRIRYFFIQSPADRESRLFEQALKISKRVLRRRFRRRIGNAEVGAFAPDELRVFLVFPVMAVQTKILPVATVRRIVVVIVIFVVYGQFVEV